MDSEEPFKPSHLAKLVITAFEKKDHPNHDKKIHVNPIVSRLAAAYEKLRNAMEYREDEVILRAAIERILKRRLLLGGNAKTTAEPLVREVIWARYMPENTVSEAIVPKVEESIDMYLQFRFKVLKQKALPEAVVNEWTYQLISSDIENIVNPNPEKETLANFMFQILKEHVEIPDDTEETTNAQVYIAVRRAFARDDVAFLRYHLFRLYFGKLTKENVDEIAASFPKGYKEIMYELTYPKRERIFAYVKRRAAAFLILEDVFRANKGHILSLIENDDELEKAVSLACDARYKSIAAKVRRAIVRSILFILLTKVIFAFAVEGTYDRFVYGQIQWLSLLLNTSVPPLLMLIVSFFIRTPGEENSKRIFSYIQEILFSDAPRIGGTLVVKKAGDKPSAMDITFNLLWLFAFVLSFGGVIYILAKLQFNIASQFVFLFFLAIVSFLSYRISLIANLYSVGDRQGLITPLVDFLFMPVVRVGRQLTQEIGRFNFIIFIFDFLIETPFKVMFAFFEQWFHFLHAKREELE